MSMRVHAIVFVVAVVVIVVVVFFFFNDTATTEIYTLSLHDALPIWAALSRYLCALRPGYLEQLMKLICVLSVPTSIQLIHQRTRFIARSYQQTSYYSSVPRTQPLASSRRPTWMVSIRLTAVMEAGMEGGICTHPVLLRVSVGDMSSPSHPHCCISVTGSTCSLCLSPSPLLLLSSSPPLPISHSPLSPHIPCLPLSLSSPLLVLAWILAIVIRSVCPPDDFSSGIMYITLSRYIDFLYNCG